MTLCLRGLICFFQHPARAEFVAKLGVVEEEADESAFWMEMIIEGELLKRELVDSLMNEAIEVD